MLVVNSSIIRSKVVYQKVFAISNFSKSKSSIYFRLQLIYYYLIKNIVTVAMAKYFNQFVQCCFALSFVQNNPNMVQTKLPFILLLSHCFFMAFWLFKSSENFYTMPLLNVVLRYSFFFITYQVFKKKKKIKPLFWRRFLY